MRYSAFAHKRGNVFDGKSKKNGDPEYEQYHDEFSYRVVFKDINDFIAGKRQKAGGKNHD